MSSKFPNNISGGASRGVSHLLALVLNNRVLNGCNMDILSLVHTEQHSLAKQSTVSASLWAKGLIISFPAIYKKKKKEKNFHAIVEL